MQNCSNCTKKNLWSPTGRFVNGCREFRCRNCDIVQLESPPQGLKIPPKVLYFDIETSLANYESFGRSVRSGWLRMAQKQTDWYVITWAAAWVSDDEFLYVHSARVSEKEAVARNDGNCIKPLWDLMDVADYWVGHNSNSFDVKKIHSRFVANGMKLPYKARQIDTYRQARKYFGEDSNKLDEWAKKFGGDGKDKMEYDDWSRINRDPKSEDLQKMEDYCRNDVREGALVYRELKKLIEGRGDVVIK